MAMSNVERQRRWVAKNRALHNFRRRKKKGGDATCDSILGQDWKTQENEPSSAVPTVQSAGAARIEELRKLVERVVAEPVESVATPQVLRNDYGAIISENQYKRLQEKKEQAKMGGYILDEYSQ